MKRIQIVVLMLMLLVVPHLVQAQKEMPWEQKLPFKNMTVEYALTGMEEGTEVLYIKDSGKMSATYHTTVTSMMGMKMENKTIEIEDPEWIYSFDLVEGIGQKTRNPKKYMMEEYEKLSAADKKAVIENSKKMGGNFMQGMGGEIEQKVTKMLGFDCDRISVMGTTTYNIHNTPITLKMESSIMGLKMSQVATSVKKSKVDDKVFAHPEGIEPVFDEQADAMMRQMAQQTMAWLKDPQAAGAGAPSMGPAAPQNRQQNIPQEDQEMMKQAEQMMQGIKGLFGN